jgi:hypothetical protein
VPLLFNVFINDIFYFVKKGTLYNYADDNNHGVGNQMPWKDPLGLRQHTDFFQGHSASPLIT